MLVIGHRGASGVAPENTMVSFRRAIELGAKYIETDLQLTRDGRLVILHDSNLRRTARVRANVSSMTLEQIRQLDAGSWFPRGRARKRIAAPPFPGERIPTLEEVLEFACEKRIGLYLEMKARRGRGAEEAVVDAIRAAKAFERVHVICFDLRVLQQVRSLEPAVSLGFLFSRRLRRPVERALSVGAKTILPHARRVSRKLIAEAKRQDLKVVTWTVNKPEQMKMLMERGVDGIMTDFPDRLAAIVNGPER